MSIESVMPSNHLILFHPFLLLPSIFPSISAFSYESALCIRWPTYWSFSFSISPSNEYSGLVSFRMDWFDLLAAQRTVKSLLQHHSSKMCILFNKTLKSLFSKMRFYTHYKFWLWFCTGCRFAPPVFFHLQFRLKDIIPWNIARSSTHSVQVHLNVLWGDKKLKLLITHDIHHIRSYSIDQSMVKLRVHRGGCY